MREIVLNATAAGMTRLRTKGGASPESLYELYNAYVNASKIPRQRPGAPFQFTCPSLSKGLVLHKGVFYTFSATPVSAVTGSTNIVLRHPAVGFAGTLKRIHFAQPYMGYLYVVAEFDASGVIPAMVVHYWLQNPKAWVANAAYKVGDMVQPTVPNGYYYKATRPSDFAPAWTPRMGHIVNDKIQPTVYNGFHYVAVAINGKYSIAAAGLTAVSGAIEPTWPTEAGQTVEESSTGAITAAPAVPPDTPDPLPPGMRDGQGDDSRYKNIGGSGGRLSWSNPTIRVR